MGCFRNFFFLFMVMTFLGCEDAFKNLEEVRYKPDLYMEDIWTSQTSVCLGDSVTLVARVSNRGKGDASSTITKLGLGSRSYEVWTEPIVAGSTKKVSCSVIAIDVGFVALCGNADYLNIIDESEENNNTYFDSVRVKNAPSGINNLRSTSRTISSITWIWDQDSAASAYKIWLNGNYLMTLLGSSNFFTAIGLPCGTPYVLQVQAVNFCGSSQVSSNMASTVDCH